MPDLDPDHDYTIALDLDEPDDSATLAARLARELGVAPDALPPLEVRKRSLDARRGRIRFHIVVGVAGPAIVPAPLREVAGPAVIVVGSGPAGAFCAYELARAGIAAIVVDRG